MPTTRTLTAYQFFAEATAEELKQAGRTRVPATEIADRWRGLSDADRKPWDTKAAAAQEAYLQEWGMEYELGRDKKGHVGAFRVKC